jgi:hypothetical protein
VSSISTFFEFLDQEKSAAALEKPILISEG